MWAVSGEGYPYRDVWGMLGRLRDSLGAQRLMWGTNWPVSLRALPYGRAVGLYRDELGTVFNNSELADIWSGTVERVWRFGKTDLPGEGEL